MFIFGSFHDFCERLTRVASFTGIRNCTVVKKTKDRTEVKIYIGCVHAFLYFAPHIMDIEIVLMYPTLDFEGGLVWKANA